jgi:hypothetical protein
VTAYSGPARIAHRTLGTSITGDADLIALARAILYNPRWPWHAAAHFVATVIAPDQHLRSQPARHRDLLVGRG